MGKSKIVIVTGVSEVKQDSNEQQRNFKTLQLTQISTGIHFNPITMRDEMAMGKPVAATINVWEQSYLDDKMEHGYNSALNTPLMGDIVTREVDPYEIPREGEEPYIATRYTCAVLGDTTSDRFEADIARAFKNAGHTLAKPAVVVEESVEQTNGVFEG